MSILAVGRAMSDLQELAGVLEPLGYVVTPIPSGKLALMAARDDPPALILVDVGMPEMNGYEVCQRLKAEERLARIPVLFFSAPGETLAVDTAFAAGGDDYLSRPFRPAEIRARVGTHLKIRNARIELEKHSLHLEELVQVRVKEIMDAQMAIGFALAKLTELRDEETPTHLERVQIFCRLLAWELRGEKTAHQAAIGPAFVENLFHASPLHDVGKVAIPDSILLKPGKLSPGEFDLVKKHTTIGAYALGLVRDRYPRNAFVGMAVEIARSHHERWDGAGYPNSLAREQIPMSARLVALADVYDTLRSRRTYKPAFTHEAACETILKGSPGQFDPDIVDAFKRLTEQFRRAWEEKQR